MLKIKYQIFKCISNFSIQVSLFYFNLVKAVRQEAS